MWRNDVTQRTIRTAVLGLWATFFVAANPANTQEPSSVHPVPPPQVRALERTSTITLDGELDEPDWAVAEPATGFLQSQPDEGEPATQRTEVRFLYDAQAIYIGARMYDSQGAAGVQTRLGRRDQYVDSDWITIIFDTFHDHLGRAQFELNPSGVRRDALGMGASSPDPSWDPVWQAATKIDSLGWVAEIRIPLSQLRFSREVAQTWGVQVVRYTQRLNERSHYAFWPVKEVGGPSRYGHLEGLRIEKQRRHVELLPYVVGRSAHVQPAVAGDPFRDGPQTDYRVGADMKYLVTTNLTLDATINPDFGQVEVDPAVVNLSQYETFLAEKRPFFIEGAGIFSYGSLNCFFCSNVSSLSVFYTRRIGRNPQGSLPSNTRWADVPEAATILGAAKLTGRTATGWSIGVLDAVTRSEDAVIIDTDGNRLTHEIEPMTNYFVGRAKKDLKGGDVVLGGIVTSTYRNLQTDELRARLNSHAELGGVDWSVWWGNKTYRFMGQFAGSSIAGDPRAILRAQLSPARYFQRPDRGGDPVDAEATGMRGYGGYARLSKDGGSWLWEGQVNYRSPGFEVNDIAFLTRADYLWMNGNLFRHYTTPTRYYRRFIGGAGGQQQYNFDGDLIDRQVHGYLGAQFRNYWEGNAFYIHRPETYEDRLTRGGPVVRRAATHTFFANLNTDSRKRLVISTNANYGFNSEGSVSYYLNADATFKPATNVSVSLGPAYSRSGSSAQYVLASDDPTATLFYGKRYVFADLVQRTISMNTRVNVTFTPTLSLELFAQPLIVSADFDNFKEFVAPRTLAKRSFGEDGSTLEVLRGDDGLIIGYIGDPDGAGAAPEIQFANPDFNFRSLRGNAVIRWEYRPGSTLFLVWTQRRQDVAPFGDLDFGRDRSALMSARPDNVFLLKVNYWLGI